MYDYAQGPMSGAYDLPSTHHPSNDPYDIYDSASIYDEVMPEGLPVTSVTECSPDLTEPQPPKINTADVPELRPAKISLADVPELRPAEISPDV